MEICAKWRQGSSCRQLIVLVSDQMRPDRRLNVLAAMADALPDPAVILDRRSVVLHRNAAAEREFPSLARGSFLTNTLRHPGLLAAIAAAQSMGQQQSVEVHQSVPNETWYRAHVAPIQGEDGKLVLTLQSLTAHKRADQLRSDFIANVSHELRTPLASLVASIDTLLGAAANDEAARERFLNIMRQQAGRMSALIDDLLSLSRIEMHQHLLPTGSVDLVLLLRQVTEGLETQAAEAEVTITIEAEESATVTGDRNELYQVFENLLDNAIKHGGDGGKVELAIEPGRSGYDYAVSVTDYGAGVEAQHVPRLTERFYRADANSSRKKKGTGLGLAIVKHIVSRHRGQLTIRSAPGEGTRVEVLLNR